MRIFKPLPQDNCELCHPFREEDFEKINLLINGDPREETWSPLSMEIIERDEFGKPFSISDSPWLGTHALIFKPEAVEVLRTLLREFGELLPLDCRKEELVLYNPTHVLPALDETSSSIVRFDSGQIMHVSRHEFFHDVVRGQHIFKITNMRVSPTYVSDGFVDLWHSSRLTGLEFNEVWHS